MKKHAVALLTALCVAAGCTASADTAKHERVYVVVNHDGEVQTLLDNVHLENGDALDVLSDRTMLKDIENVSGHETTSDHHGGGRTVGTHTRRTGTGRRRELS